LRGAALRRRGNPAAVIASKTKFCAAIHLLKSIFDAYSRTRHPGEGRGPLRRRQWVCHCEEPPCGDAAIHLLKRIRHCEQNEVLRGNLFIWIL
jgi:hypothetical protein